MSDPIITIEEAIRAYLMSELPAIFSNRIYPERFPTELKGTAIMYTVVSEVRIGSHQGFSKYVQRRIQFVIRATTFAGGSRAAEAFKSLLGDYRGLLSGLRVFRLQLASELSQDEPETQRYDRIVDVIAHYNPIPEAVIV